MAGEIDLARGLNVKDTSNIMMGNGVVKAASGSSHVGENTGTGYSLGRSPSEAANKSLHEEELEGKTQESCSPSKHDDNFNLANGASEEVLERYNNNPDEETQREEKPKETLKRCLSQPQISAFLKKDSNKSPASKRVKLDVLNDNEVDYSSGNKESKEVEANDREIDAEEGNILEERERKANEDESYEDKIEKRDDDRKKCEDNKDMEETKEDKYERRKEDGDANNEIWLKEEKEEDDRQAEKCEKQKLEDGGQKLEDSQQKEDKGDRKEDEGQKKDNNEEKSSKKSIDEQGLPSGWLRLSVPRKNGTQVDYYIVNQQVCYTCGPRAKYSISKTIPQNILCPGPKVPITEGGG